MTARLRRRLAPLRRFAVSTLGAGRFVVETARAYRTRARIARFRQRLRVAHRFPEARAGAPRERVLAVVTHVTDGSRHDEVAAERLTRTLEGLQVSFGHTRLGLVVNTLPGRHVAARLPEHLREAVTVRENADVDPMFVGFEAQREFEQRADDADWFLYLEDDLVLADSLWLDKLAYFNAAAPPEALLIPHRYELWRGRKIYIDLVSKSTPEWFWNRLTVLDVADWRFAEFDNPHSGAYCLSRAQLSRWLATGRRWYGLPSYYGGRESAATGCLAEAFRLYKPHPDNLGFLELRHWDTKYSRLFEERHGLDAANRTMR